MKFAAPLVLPLAAMLLLLPTGCSKEKTQTVDYYKSHPAERGKRTTECDTYGDDSQDCRNAREAQLDVYAAPAADNAAEADNATEADNTTAPAE